MGLRHLATVVSVVFCYAVTGASASGQVPQLSEGSKYLLRLIEANKASEVAEQIDSGLLDPNERFEDGNTMLLWAARGERSEVARVLLDRGAKIDLARPNGMTALMIAAERYRSSMVQYLLDAGANPNLQDREGYSAFHHCVNWGYIDVFIDYQEPEQARIIRMLAGKSGNPDLRDKKGRTALMIAAGFRHQPQLDALLEIGADVGATDIKGRTALTYCSRSGLNSDVVKSLVRAGAKPQLMDLLQLGEVNAALKVADVGRETLGEYDQTTLMQAVEIGSLEVVKALLDTGSEVNRIDSRGLTPLHLVLGKLPVRGQFGDKMWIGEGATANRLKILQLLLNKGAAVDAVAGDSQIFHILAEGETALVWATELNYLEMMKTLLRAGADPRGKAGPADDFVYPPLVVASQIGSLEGMKILLSFGAPPSYGSPLHKLYGNYDASRRVSPSTRTEQVRLLLASKANPNVGADFYGRGALQNAVVNSNVESVKLLLAAGADVNYRLQWNGETALMAAVRNKDIGMVKILIGAGADKKVKNRDGETAIDIAVSQGLTEIVKLLRR